MIKLINTTRRNSSGARRLLAVAAAVACTSGAGSAFAQSALDYPGRWTFDDCGASFNLKDSSGNNATATRGSSVQCTTDADSKPNGAVNLVFSKTGDGTAATNVTIKNVAALGLTNQVSLSVKVKPTALPEGAILTKGWTSTTAGAQKTFQLAIQKDAAGVNRLTFTLWMQPSGGGAAVPVKLTSNVKINPSEWSRVGAEYSPATAEQPARLQLFINGVVVASQAESRAIADAPSGVNASIWMGGGAPGQTKGYTGAIDNLWIANGSCADLDSARVPVKEKELMITDLSVVEDATGRTTGRGAWTFARLMEQMVPATPDNPQLALDAASDMVEAMFKTWTTNQTINGINVTARPAITGLLFSPINGWPRINGKLDLTQAPVRLLAIVNRIDQRDLDQGQAGEGRFVFGVLNSAGGPTQFTIILEYSLPALTAADIRLWGRDWHALGTKTLPSEPYNAALQAITDRFTMRGAAPGRFNGNAINQVRTNEIALASPWQLRQFQLGANPANLATPDNPAGATRLLPAPIALTPDISFNGTAVLTSYINANATAILQERHTVPLKTGNPAVSFLAGAAPISSFWNTSGLIAPAGSSVSDLRHKFALNTCGGCHSGRETNTGFTHIDVRGAGASSELSGFLKGGISVTDPVDTTIVRTFDDLTRRQQDMQTKVLACPAPQTQLAARSMMTTSTTSGVQPIEPTLTKGISRVH